MQKLTEEQKNEIREMEIAITGINISIDLLKDTKRELYHQIWEIVGSCPLCDNAHYPFCGEELTIYPATKE